MANSDSTTFPSKKIEAIQTIVPSKPTSPRQPTLITINQNHRANIFRRCLNIVLYYNKVSQSDSGWVLAGWCKESLGKALVEHQSFAGRVRPHGTVDGCDETFAGRVRPHGTVDGCDDTFEIVFNDCGVRLYEVRMDMELNEFLSLDDKEEGEAQLVHWEDIDEIHPQFCPLLYVQVSNFKCGGYSIGFSCSVLLADPFTLTNFIKNWAYIHKNIVSHTKIPKVPLFYNRCIEKNGFTHMNENGIVQSKNKGQTTIIELPSEEKDMNLGSKEVADMCIKVVEQNLSVNTKLPAKFCLYTKERADELRVDIITSKNGEVTKNSSRISSAISVASWEQYFGALQICLHEGNRPSRVSYWINSIDDEGLVMAIPFSDEGKLGNQIVVVTI